MVRIRAIAIIPLFLGGWGHLDIPPQCDYEPNKPYTVQVVPSGTCGGGSLACMSFTKKECLIQIEPPFDAQLYQEHLRHEKAHCNCPWWVD